MNGKPKANWREYCYLKMHSSRNRADRSVRKSLIAMPLLIVCKRGSRKLTDCSPFLAYPQQVKHPLPLLKGKSKKQIRRSLVLNIKYHHYRSRNKNWKKRKYNQINSPSLSPKKKKTQPDKSPSCSKKRQKNMSTWLRLKHTLHNSWSRYNKIKDALMQPSSPKISS